MGREILLEQTSDGISTIVFNRPDAMNALNRDAMAQFSDTIDKLAADAGLRAVILTGAGSEAFCSGGDLYELSELTTEDQARGFITLMGNALYRLEHLPVPVIAAVNGYALGGGSEIALACDMRITDEKVRMGFVQIRLALTPGWGAGQRLLRLVGYPKAMDILLHGQVIHAVELEQLGLTNKVVEAGTAYDHALNLARHITQHSPAVVRGVKSLLRAGIEQPYEAALQAERDVFPPLWAADPHLQAVELFLRRQREKRDEV